MARGWAIWSCAFSVVLLAQKAPAPERTAPEIFAAQCASCHGTAQMSGLDLRTRESILKGGKRGPSIVLGQPDQSLLMKAILREGDLKMPPGKQGLSADEVSAIRTWIADGASWKTVTKNAEPSWWAFKKPIRPPVPAFKSGVVANPIDAFILSQLKEKGLSPSPRADKRTLIRRAYFDLHGLPPSEDEVETFLNDSRPDAWERIVDGLLASPRYGERWGRMWLDVVRYADTGGFETDLYYQNAWRYRDYVIQAFNSDKPYNVFVQEQIAADELWPDNLDLEGSYQVPQSKLDHLNARLATGLYTFGPVMHESGLDGESLRSEWLTDAADTTGAAFMGLTYGCAKCHDHKFDPITARDYYRMQAVFAGSEQKEIPLVPVMSVFDYWQGLPKLRAVNDLAKAVQRISERAKQRILDRIKQKYSAEVLEAFNTPEASRTPKQKELAIDLEAAYRGIGEKDLDQEYTTEERKQRQELIEKIGYAYLKAPTQYPTATVLGHAEIVPETHILERGDYKKKGALVNPGLPGFLVENPDIEEPSGRPIVPQRRKALALWLTQPDNPLTARVMVNRIWQGHFTRGLAGTPNDFGRQGERPTNPQLLDWLAVEFVEKRWSVKSMHRLIMLSNAYQMSSASDESNAKIDGQNHYLWRMNRRRLEAEMVRDSVLSVAGSINLKAGGPPVIPPLTREEMAGLKDSSQWPVDLDKSEHMRRSVYLYVKRSFRMPLFEAFDMPDTSFSCERRNVTTVAPQALALMNNDFMLEQAQIFAERLIREQGEEPAKWIDAAWRSAMGRPPVEGEKQDALRFLQLQNHNSKARLTRLCLAILNMNEFLYVD